MARSGRSDGTPDSSKRLFVRQFTTPVSAGITPQSKGCPTDAGLRVLYYRYDVTRAPRPN